MSIEYWTGIKSQIADIYGINEDNKNTPAGFKKVHDILSIGDTSYEVAENAIKCEKMLIDYNKIIEDQQEYVIEDMVLEQLEYHHEKMKLEMDLKLGKITQEEYDKKIEELNPANTQTNSSYKKNQAEGIANDLISSSDELSSILSKKLAKIWLDTKDINIDFDSIASQGKNLGNLLQQKVNSVTN